LPSTCTFKDIERFSISYGDTVIQVTKTSPDHVEVAMDQDDIRGVKNTIRWWHVVCSNLVECSPALYKAIWIQFRIESTMAVAANSDNELRSSQSIAVRFAS
jgi:hypothetical protein